MKQEQTAAPPASTEQSPVAGRRPRRAGRGTTPVAAFRTAWLILLAALAMTVLEGAFRKWSSPFTGGIGKYLMYFSKDIIFAALLFFPKRSLPSQPLTVFQNWLLPGCGLLAMGALSSSVHDFNPVGALLTARATIILPVIALLAVPRLSGLPLRWVLWLLIAFTVVNFALGVEQNRLPADNILNRYTEDTTFVSGSQDYGVRATGTFSYITGLGIMSSVGVWAGLALMGLSRTQWQRIGAWAALAAGFGCGLAAVSRAPIVIGVAMIGGWMVFSRVGVATLTRGLVAAIICVVVAAVIGITPVFSRLGQGLMERNEGASDSFNHRAFGQLGDMIFAIQTAPLGEGFGTHQVGGAYAVSGEMNLFTIETQMPRMVLETGVLGLIGYLIVCAGALLALQRAKREVAGDGARAALLTTQMLLAALFYYNDIFEHTGSAFAWMIFAAALAGVEMRTKQTVATRISASK